jgi:CHAD domain-containing protein
MAYQIFSAATLTTDFERIATAELSSARAKLAEAGADFDAAVHDARKHLKRVRALVRLVQGGLGTDFRSLDRALSGVARILAPAREEAALEECVAQLSSANLGDTPILDPAGAPEWSKALSALSASLSADRRHSSEADASRALLEEASAGFETLIERMRRTDLRGKGWSVLESGFRRTYASGKTAFRNARRTPIAEHVHAWRKHAKYHFYQMQLLEPVWPGPLNARRRELDALCDLLGHHHDLSLLRQALSAPSSPHLGLDLPSLASLIDIALTQVTARAFLLGRRAYAERPRALARQFGAYFAAWQIEARDDNPERSSGPSY